MKDLHFDNDKCYPALQKSNEELDLENFAKQVVTTVNEVIQKSRICWTDQLQHDLSDNHGRNFSSAMSNTPGNGRQSVLSATTSQGYSQSQY